MLLLVIWVPLMVAVALVFPAVQYNLSLARLAVFVLSLIGGFLLNMLITAAFGMLAFWSTQVRNLYSLWYGIGQFLSGWIAPLAIYPPSIRRLAIMLPFWSTIGFPMESLMGRLSWSETWLGFLVTGVWIAIFGSVYRLLWYLGRKRYDAVGS